MARPRLNWTLSGDGPLPGLEPESTVRYLTADDIDVVFQPIVDLQNEEVFAYEALARCKKPQYANPLVMFQHAAKERTCGRLGRTIRDVTFGRCAGMPVFINVHPDELTARWLVRPDDPLYFHDAQVYIEITEAAALSHFDLCAGVLKDVCSRAGAHLVIDDFGAGFSNLKRVLDLDPSVVKLDQTLIRGIDRSPRQQLLVQHLVHMYADLGAWTVAEGIETPEELMAVIDTGCHFGQGYALGRPSYPPPVSLWPLEPGRAGGQ